MNTRTDIVSSPQYLLFAGTQLPPQGGLRDLVGTFSSEQEARQAFREVRLQPSSRTNWAQLAVVDADRGVKPLAWFGIGAAPDGRRVDQGERLTAALETPPNRRSRVPKRTTTALTAIVAVASVSLGFLINNSDNPSPGPRKPAQSVPGGFMPIPFEPPALAGTELTADQ